jgi:hypothetical protein
LPPGVVIEKGQGGEESAAASLEVPGEGDRT